jgi:glyoxylase-like metal-dependent hydrolase (beta-lactamase superfamily II)
MGRTFDELRDEWRARVEMQRAELTARWEEVWPEPFRFTREVVPGLYQVRTSGARSYLVLDETITVIDAGNPGSGARILAAVRELGRAPEDVRDIVITHAHIDHVGGLPELQQQVPARTAIHFAEARDLETAEPLPNPFVNPVLGRLFAPYLIWNDPGCARVDLPVADGDELPVFGGLRVVHAPGHTPGSISLHFPAKGVLIVGDAMQFRFGRLMLPHRLFTKDLLLASESVQKLARLEFETLCFSHFRPIIKGAGERVRAFAETLAS